ncbi:MAG: hypothetical protein ACTSYM_03140 [Candidatus Baldrarchaeia archaeon]
MSTYKKNTVKIWFAISITLMLLLFILPTSAQKTLTFGVEEGATWTLHHETVSAWESEGEAGRETDISNKTIIFLNVTGNTIYLNHSVFRESTYQGKNETETYAYNYTEVYTYNLTDLTKFLNETIMTVEFPYILPVNWSLIENTLQQLNQTSKTATVYFKEVPEDYIGDKPVDVIFIAVEINETDSYTSDNTNYTYISITSVEGKYGRKTGILLEENYFSEHYSYEDSTLIEYYNMTGKLWITNSSFTYWEEVTEQPSEEQSSENETFPEITSTTIATSTSGAISGIISATIAVVATTGVSGVSTTVTTSVGQAVAPSLVPSEEATKGFESARSRFSWKYLKYLLKLRKLKRKKKKEEIPPPKNTIKMTIALAIIGAITGSGAAAIAYGLSAPLTLLVMLVTAVVGFTLAEAGLSLFTRRYVFYRVRSIQWGKKEKLSLLITLITGLYGVVTSFISAALLAKVVASLVTVAVIPTGIIAYFTAEEIAMMTSAE